MQEDAVGVAAKESVGKGLGEEVVVFKESKDEQVEYDISPKVEFRRGTFGGRVVLFVADSQTRAVTAQGGEGDKQQKTPIPPAIEEVRSRNHKSVLPTQLLVQ